MCIDLDWTTTLAENSSFVLDRNHLMNMARDDFHHAADRISSFLDAIIGMNTEVEWNDGHAEIFPLILNGWDEQVDAVSVTDNGQNDERNDSYVPANDPYDDADWQVEDLLALLDNLGRIGHQGVIGINFKAGTCNLSDGTVIRMTGWNPLVERINNHLNLLESAAMFKTGFPTIRSSNHTLRLDTERILDIKHGTVIALGMVRLRHLSAC